MLNDSDCYTNTIVHRTKGKDPSRDERMATDELSYAMNPTAVDRIYLQQRYGHTAWVPYYLFVIRRRLKREVANAHVSITENASEYTIHFWRRVIAFFHQEVELWTQGVTVWNAASSESVLVMYGQR